MKVRILGADPSFRNFGMVLVDYDVALNRFEIAKMHIEKTAEEKVAKLKSKVVDGKRVLKKTKVRPTDVRKNADDIRRAKALHDSFQEYAKQADIVIAEVPIGSQDARAMASYGVCMGLLASCPTPLIQVTPTAVKLEGTGIATATKEEMIEAASIEFPKAPWLRRKFKGDLILTSDNEHLADAIYAIKAGLGTPEFCEWLIDFKTAQRTH